MKTPAALPDLPPKLDYQAQAWLIVKKGQQSFLNAFDRATGRINWEGRPDWAMRFPVAAYQALKAFAAARGFTVEEMRPSGRRGA